MANIYTLKSGLASDTTVWSGGVVPVSGDRVLIMSGHTVTLDGSYEWGDDSTATVTINGVSTTNSITIEGVLKASRSVSSQITCKGNLAIMARTGVTGAYDAGTEADPIPLGVNHTCVLNKSATPAHGKYGLDLVGTTTLIGRISAHGHARRRNAVLVSAVSAGATSATVDDATGWQVGDQVVLAPTASPGAHDLMTISSVTPTAGTEAIVGFSAALLYAHALDASVGNFTSNVIFSPNSAGGGAMTHVSLASAGFSAASGNTGRIHLCHVLFVGTGSSGTNAYRFGMLSLNTGNVSNVTDALCDEFRGLAFYAVGTGVSSTGQLSMLYTRNRHKFTDTAFFSLVGGAGSIYEFAAAVADFEDMVVYRTQGNGQYSAYSQGGCNIRTIGKSRIFGAASYPCALSSAFADTHIGTVYGPSSNASGFIQAVNASGAVFDRVDFGYTFGRGSIQRLVVASGAYWTSDLLFKDCMFAPELITRPSQFNVSLPSYVITIQNKNQDVTAQEIHTPPGSYYRDNDVRSRGTSAIRLEPDSAATYAQAKAVDIPAANGKAITVVGALRKNAAYGSATRPSVTLSGLGITPQTFTMTDSTDTWESFAFTATQTSGADGNLTLTFSAQSVNAGAAAWFDGVPVPPFITAVRHYGYKFQETSVTREVDPVIQLSEAAAGALTGLSMDWGSLTLTVTGQRTLSEIYDWCHAQMVQTANLSRPEFITSADGANFNLSADLVIDGGAIVGAGALAMTGITLNVSNGGWSEVNIAHDAGVFTTIRVAGYNTGARLQIYDATAAVELYNAVPAGATVMLNANWTADHTLRLRMARTAGVDADLPVQTFGVLGASGASFLLSPAADAVYEANAIDGSSVTEFAADYPNVQIDVSDADGVTSPHRAYAWYLAGLMTADGIANFHGAITAEDQANYRINAAVADMRVQNIAATAVVISGARIYRSDGASIFAAGAGPIQLDPLKAYVAALDIPTAATTAAAVRAELAAELGRIDATISSRLAGASYTAPANSTLADIAAVLPSGGARMAGEGAVAKNLDQVAVDVSGLATSAEVAAVPADVRSELATELSRLDAAVSTRADVVDVASVPGAVRAELATELARVDAAISSRATPANVSAVPGAVRVELATELSRLDAAVSSRLAASAYTAPNNEGIASVVAALPSAGAKMAGEGATAKNLDQVTVDLSPLATGAAVAGVPAAVRAELTAELSRIDTPVSSRLAGAAYTAPDNAAFAMIPAAVRTELTDELAMLDASVSSRLPSAGYIAPPSAADNAAAVSSALAAETIPVDVRKINGLAVAGSGTGEDPWGPA